MLGGVDHLAAFMQAEQRTAPIHALVAAGPVFFMDPSTRADGRTQALFKAEALASSLRDMGLLAWAPGANDWAAGVPELEKLTALSGATPLAKNLGGTSAGVGSEKIIQLGALKLGLVGVSHPVVGSQPVAGVSIGDPKAAAAAGRVKLDAEGADLRVLLASLPRGEALRLVEAVPGYHLVVVGKPVDSGESNDPPSPPVIVGKTLVIQTPNHLQAVGIVDFYVRDGVLDFQDASGLSLGQRREALERRIQELDERISDWERQGDVNGADLEARRADRDAARRELALLAEPKPPESGSYFRYRLLEIREALGADPRVGERLLGYYGRVNEHNRVAFQDRRPEPPPEGKSGYVGASTCAGCHVSQHDFWTKTGHSKAYATLTRQHKEFNLDCVSCHVTGYDEPGGSTVVHVGNLTAVQCETCHGPASRHVSAPEEKGLVTLRPERTLCAEKCHHPPHVNPGWDVAEAWAKIVGPGHGR